MTPESLYLFTGVAIWAMGLKGLLLVRHTLRRIIAVNLMSSGVFLIMIALASRSDPPDPLLQALVGTLLIVAFSATAFAVRMESALAQHGPDQPANRQESKDDEPERGSHGR